MAEDEAGLAQGERLNAQRQAKGNVRMFGALMGAACQLGGDRLNPGVNIFVLGWFWNGLKGHSVTFATLFALFLFGVSVAGGVGRLLSALGVHWLYVLLAPSVLFWWLNKKEPQWIPDPVKRKRIARSLLFGSIVLAVVINQIRT